MGLLLLGALGACVVDGDLQELNSGPGSTGNFVAGGDDVVIKDAPWTVALVHVMNTGEVLQFCGGVYLGGRWVLTAAHCITPPDVQLVVADDEAHEYRMQGVANLAVVFNMTSFDEDVVFLRDLDTGQVEAIADPSSSEARDELKRLLTEGNFGSNVTLGPGFASASEMAPGSATVRVREAHVHAGNTLQTPFPNSKNDLAVLVLDELPPEESLVDDEVLRTQGIAMMSSAEARAVAAAEQTGGEVPVAHATGWGFSLEAYVLYQQHPDKTVADVVPSHLRGASVFWRPALYTADPDIVTLMPFDGFTCGGDSGGPYVAKNAAGVDRLIGIVSSGDTPCSGGSLYSPNLLANSDWIWADVICKGNSADPSSCKTVQQD